MIRSKPTGDKRRFLHVVVILILLGLAANIVLTLRVAVELTELSNCPTRRTALPCAAIPTTFILQEPRCADKLLQAMKLTNVRISTTPGTVSE